MKPNREDECAQHLEEQKQTKTKQKTPNYKQINEHKAPKFMYCVSLA